MKSLLNVAALLWILVAFQQVSAGAEGRPNVVVILADDLGYGDTSVFDGCGGIRLGRDRGPPCWGGISCNGARRKPSST